MKVKNVSNKVIGFPGNGGTVAVLPDCVEVIDDAFAQTATAKSFVEQGLIKIVSEKAKVEKTGTKNPSGDKN